ncbi:MAG TPA: NfeD family protein [Candidatus Dormibacteraeota bacterium]|nr:NfeD family protein [Candidatus Dormibacteraeota bacterium]
MRHLLSRPGRSGGLLLATGALLLLFAGTTVAQAPTVVVLPTTGVVDQVMAGYLHDGIANAAQQGAAAVVIELDTPGGSLEATNDIVGDILEADVPVITWVAPSGGRAASAGTFITLAGDIALMAPGTSIGAASPVDASGGDIGGTLGEKVRNDAAAKIQSIAEEQGRNVDWARSTVLDAASASASEAVSVGAVDGIAANLDQVLAFADGKTVKVGTHGQEVTLELTGATTTEAPMGPLQTFLHLLADPNIAFVLFVIGGLGLATELIHPNLVTGIVGAICLVLAFIGFGSLPLNVAGVILIGIGLLLFVLEVNIPSHGLLTAGGLIALALGAAALYSAPGTPTGPDVAVALPVMAVVLLLAGAFMVVVIAAATRVRRLKAAPGTVGTSLAPGIEGEVRRPLGPTGSVYVGGEEWSARSFDGGALPRGTRVRVVRQDGIVVIVEPLEAAGAAGQEATLPSS